MERVSAASRTYTVVLVPNELGGYSVEVPALPGCFTHGASVEQALERAREAIEVHIAGLEADGDDVPEERDLRPVLGLVTV
jgi:antitoxin HicB